MSESTFYRANQDRIVLHAGRQGWTVTYYRATSIRGSWLRRLFAPPAVFQQVVESPSQVHVLLMRHGLNLTRAESQRLSSMLSALRSRERADARRLA